MIIFKSINKLNKEVNFKADTGFVPTMGALHRGHISLIKRAKKESSKVIVSIFVNPSQFNKSNDFKKYPRNINKDLIILKKLKVDFVLIPSAKDIFKNQRSMKIKISKNDKVLCAKFRPGHFEGVLGVINQFLKKIQSKRIYLGEKDFQQIYLIKKFIKNKFKIKVCTCKTVRGKGFLPLSSRNNLLKKNEIKKASLISQNIKKFYFSIKSNFNNKHKIFQVRNNLNKMGVVIEYIELRNKNTLSKKFNKRNFKLFIAFYVNKVRLIDNI